MIRTLLLSVRGLLVSLRTTVVLLALSIILVFWATLAQVHLGVWAVQQRFFHSLVVFEDVGGFQVPVFPGGYAIGGLLLANLVAAQVYRLRWSASKIGIWIAHAGLILLLLGELASGLLQRDDQMRLDEGETKAYAESSRRYEMVVVDETDPAVDQVVAVPESFLAKGTVVQHPRLPFRIEPRFYFANSVLQMRAQAPNAPANPATQGLGTQLAITPVEVTYKENEANIPTAFVELVGSEGSLGVWAVSPALAVPQRFDAAGRHFRIAMRRERHYEPFSLTLLKFSHDVYPGTDIPKNFSSRVRINPADGSAPREVLIYMNNPLRYSGLTFYQAGYENNDRTTILQVVRNPSWLVPYIACAAITLGLLIQFTLHLARFSRKEKAAR
jgi:ResB-like family